MVMAPPTIREDYWQTFELQDEDIEFLYNYLLEVETPLTPAELLNVLVKERIRREIDQLERQRSTQAPVYTPKEIYAEGQKLLFPALGWQQGTVIGIRPGKNPNEESFQVARVAFPDGAQREFAAGYQNHPLNKPPEFAFEDENLSPDHVIHTYRNDLVQALERGLQAHTGFVRIAGRWFPLALLVDINAGHLNLAEAVLDMAGGGPMSTPAILEQIEMDTRVNPKLVEFSFDHALESDERFDEVGPAGETLWYLRRLEPEQVRNTPAYLRYPPVEYDPAILTPEMLALIDELDDELSAFDPALERARRELPRKEGRSPADKATARLIFPHWYAGTLPLSTRIASIFPSAYEAPRVRFILVDGESGEKLPAWVVRQERYVFGLKGWYQSRGLGPGSLVHVQRGKRPGEVVIQAGVRRSSRDWMRTVLVGTDGGMVFAMLRQIVQAEYDERMAFAIPDLDALDGMWKRPGRANMPLERVVVNMARELTKLNPQGHVHASELYAAVNLVRRCPPGPMLALLASRPWFVHVGDLHFRFDDSEQS
jgi:hypothetical protein